ncbi:MAG: putative DNA-binding domain-containing protein [Thermomonas sp.]
MTAPNATKACTSPLREQLEGLAAHVRDPTTQPGPPGIEDRRLAIYRELAFNNLDGLLAGNFPVIRKTVGDTDWHGLVRRFLAEHRSRTPIFTEIGLELIEFLESEAGSDPQRPWMAELAHYEWAELGLTLSDATMLPHDPHGDLLTGVPVLSPLAWPLAYQWPVARIGPDFQPRVAPDAPTLVLLRREADGQVHFSSLSPLLYQLLVLVGANTEATGSELLRGLARDVGETDVPAFIEAARPMLQRLHDEGVVPGIQLAAA